MVYFHESWMQLFWMQKALPVRSLESFQLFSNLELKESHRQLFLPPDLSPASFIKFFLFKCKKSQILFLVSEDQYKS